MQIGKVMLIIILAVFGAIYMGVGAATDVIRTLAISMTIVGVSVCLILGRKIWMLIPLGMYMDLSVRLPGQPTTLLLTQFALCVFGILMITAGKLRVHKFKMTSLDWCLLILLLCVMQVYARNPVGVNLFGASNVGGRAYIFFAVSLVSAIILSRIQVPYQDLKKMFRLVVVGGILNFVLGVFGYFVPFLGQFIGTGVVQDAASSSQAVDAGRATRVPFAKRIGVNIALWISSMIDPVKACFNVLWLPLILFAFAAAGVSGFRNVIASVGLTFLVGIIYQGGIRSLLVSAGSGAMVLIIVAVINTTSPLPPNIQRAMSFLPGTWDEEYVESGKDSTEWRVEMWEEALLTDNWIHNKLLGDGLGFTRAELAYQEELKYTGSRAESFGFDAQRASFLVSGDYHSGPVSAIRTIGYVGLMVMIIFMLMQSYKAHKLIMKSKGMIWRPLVMIICIPIVWYPIFFLFVYGIFQRDTVIIIMGYGLLRLLENNLPFDMEDQEIEALS